jgi:HEAT repeat protein
LAAIEQLPFLDDQRVVPTFLAALREDVPRVRAAAARIGGSLDSPEVDEALVAALADAAPWVRYHAARSLAKRGASPAFESLRRIVESDPAPHVRIAALEATGALGGDRAIDLLAPFVSADDADVACAALVGLGATHAGRALPMLRTAARASDARRRPAALDALAEIGTAEAVEVLQWIAAVERDADIAAAAIAALGEIRSPGAIAALLGLLAEPGRRDAVGDVLIQLGQDGIADMARGLQHPDPAIRRTVVEIVVRSGQRSVWQVLDAALEDSDPAVRLAAVDGLASFRPQDVAARLGQIVATDDDAQVRRAAHTLIER